MNLTTLIMNKTNELPLNDPHLWLNIVWASAWTRFTTAKPIHNGDRPKWSDTVLLLPSLYGHLPHGLDGPTFYTHKTRVWMKSRFPAFCSTAPQSMATWSSQVNGAHLTLKDHFVFSILQSSSFGCYVRALNLRKMLPPSESTVRIVRFDRLLLGEMLQTGKQEESWKGSTSP